MGNLIAFLMFVFAYLFAMRIAFSKSALDDEDGLPDEDDLLPSVEDWDRLNAEMKELLEQIKSPKSAPDDGDDLAVENSRHQPAVQEPARVHEGSFGIDSESPLGESDSEAAFPDDGDEKIASEWYVEPTVKSEWYSPSIAIWYVVIHFVAAAVAILVMLLWEMLGDPPLKTSDSGDAYRDAPVGQTRGYDTF